MLSYHIKTGLKESVHAPTGVLIGTYWMDTSWPNFRMRTKYWQLRVKRRTKGSRWVYVETSSLPKRLKVEALILGIPL